MIWSLEKLCGRFWKSKADADKKEFNGIQD